jgi:hypothetical protein
MNRARLSLLWIATSILMTWPGYAHQAVDVADPPDHPSTSEWEVETDTVDIDGDPGPLASDARKNWKAACEKWRTEFREDNKESKIINLTCGTPTCSGNVGNKSCVSKGTYKMKTKRDDD